MILAPHILGSSPVAFFINFMMARQSAATASGCTLMKASTLAWFTLVLSSALAIVDGIISKDAPRDPSSRQTPEMHRVMELSVPVDVLLEMSLLHEAVFLQHTYGTGVLRPCDRLHPMES